ncbi:Alpha/Beta hydrolase protein [Massariosphaeria phaeospora]|uniref:Alpha/Beta hydrolase protein n=1 Tax=Massariosphaeria phaeospora TaxID=100035 RepID=A0A7C8II94_9PLEO|nr:Alpha/Beta hydrolase protein [Massariosphaeria phaeospora]
MFSDLLLFTWLGFLCNHATASPVVRIEKSQISYRGTTVDSIEHFQNVKFAQDTSGKRRFAPPELYTPPVGSEVDASTAGTACPQVRAAMPPFFAETTDISEDCLNLRISRPAGTTSDSNLPVVVWVHGGGVVKGSAYDPHSEPDEFLKLSQSINKPVIYIAINYRLTIFGFARLPILQDRKSLNVGIRDQRAGFQWITPYGLSAGGTFTSLHLMAYGGEEGVPFTQAWMMSGPPGTALNMSSDATTLHTQAVAEKVGCKSSEEYSVANHPPTGLFTFIPSVDGDLFPDRQSVLYKAGKFVKNIPMVFGWNQDDGAMNFGPAHLIQTGNDMIPAIENFAHTLTAEDFSSLFSLYDADDFTEDVKNYEAQKDESELTVSHSNAADPTFAGTRLYVLNQSMLTPLWKGAGMPYVGVSHGSDTNYIFNGVIPEGQISEEDQKLSRDSAEAFINFAYTGNPSTPGSGFGEWPEAFPDTESGVEASGPRAINVEVIGGPYGTGPVQVAVEPAESLDTEGEYGAEEGLDQQKLSGSNVGAMDSRVASVRKKEVERELLLKRCAFINSLAEKLGN